MGEMILQRIVGVTLILACFAAAEEALLRWAPSTLSAYVIAYAAIILTAWVVSRTWGPVSVRFGVLMLIAYGAILVLRSYSAFVNYGQFIDLAHYESAVRQFSAFRMARIWDIGSFQWSQHFEPILLLFVPVYWLGLGGSGLLVIVQSALAVTGAAFLYRIARHRVPGYPFAAVGLASAYLLSGGLQSAFLYGFHPIAVFPFFFLAAAYAYERRNAVWYAVLLTLTLAVKEEASFIVPFWGIWLLIGRKDVRYGLPTIAAGMLWYMVSFGIIERFSGGYEYWGQFPGGAQGGLSGMVSFAFAHPGAFIGSMFSDERKLPMLIELFGSFGFLPLLAPLSLILILPELLLKLLSSDIAMLNSFHYSAAVTALLSLSAVEGCAELVRKRAVPSLGAYLIGVAVLANMLYGFAFYYRTYAMRFGSAGPDDFIRSEHARAVDRTLAKIPHGASVSCEYAICPHIDRPYGKKLPVPHATLLEYVILDPPNRTVLVDTDVYRSFIESRILPGYRLIGEDDGVLLFTARR